MNPNIWRPTGDAPHIVLDEQGRAFILGSRMRVSMIWVNYCDNGHSAERVLESYEHLTLAQIHAALSYYYDHSDAVEAEIADEVRFVEEMRAKAERDPRYKAWKERLLKAREAMSSHEA